MECVVLGLRNQLGYAFVQPYGAELRKDQTLIIPATKAKGALLANAMVLEQVGAVVKDKLKFGAWEISNEADHAHALVVDDDSEKQLEGNFNKSMSGKKKSKNKRV